MTTVFERRFGSVGIFTLGCVIFLSDRCLAGGSACVPGSSVNVCVEWSQGPNPVPEVDFRVSFDAPFDNLNPLIQLREGDAGWKVYAELVASPGTPANIGALTIAPNAPTDNFVVTIVRPTQQGDQPGAANVGTINLDAASWTGHSSMGTGSHITGDLTGSIVVKADANDAGGEFSLRLDGGVPNAGSLIQAPVVRNCS
ncbi:hypothetical protein RAS1_20110 [Phycisphaerae bacterium RAS1]|nr:hypothetical protein RAS1_20110 [Phycisphaerae bacterium RAS1]